MNTPSQKPVLVYDGDCKICRYWVEYWNALTADSVDYKPYQDVLLTYPKISEQEFKRSIQLFTPDRAEPYSGAEAVYVLLRKHFPYNLYNWLYKKLPGFSWLTESAYHFFAKHRNILKWTSYLCWGRQHRPASYELTSWMFLRVLGLIYLSAFISLGTQITGLVGRQGILPVAEYLQIAKDNLGAVAWFRIPTIFWISDSDSFLIACCIAGALCGFLIAINRATRPCLVLAYLLYLSCFYGSQIFLRFQWDLLLLECGFLAIFLGRKNWIIPMLYRLLIFRFMLLGGLVKIISADPAWDNLTALTYHFETQPLPTMLAWYAHHLPESVLVSLAALTLITELVFPFFILLTRNFRIFAGIVFILFQTGIILTGNYNFFNLLTIAGCLFLFDDRALECVLPKILFQRLRFNLSAKPHVAVIVIVTGIIISMNINVLWRAVSGNPVPVLSAVSSTLAPLLVVNMYGPFAIMTRTRHEIIIEGSNNGKYWQEIPFRYNPGDLYRRPAWIIPHQPRLDWQMWFASLTTADRIPWFSRFLEAILLGKEEVLALLGNNPFQSKPPRYIRAVKYEYKFTTPETLESGNQWWERRPKKLYFPSSSLPPEK